jgi:hypothetical protein
MHFNGIVHHGTISSLVAVWVSGGSGFKGSEVLPTGFRFVGLIDSLMD